MICMRQIKKVGLMRYLPRDKCRRCGDGGYRTPLSARIVLPAVALCLVLVAETIRDYLPPFLQRHTIVASAFASVSRQVNIAVIGDSLVSGYGIPKGYSYPEQLEGILRTHDYNISVANYGRSGDTTESGARRIDNIPVEQYNLIIIVLGGNDMLKGEMSVETSLANLDKIIRRIRERNPAVSIILGGVKAHPGHPSQYREDFDDMYQDISNQYGILLYPFILEGAYGEEKMMLRDTIHPSALGVAEMARRTAPLVARTLNRIFSRTE